MCIRDRNGKVTASDGKTEFPIQFTFSGDDDVWVYVDGKLALDVGGAHGRVDGKLDFSNKTATAVSYTHLYMKEQRKMFWQEELDTWSRHLFQWVGLLRNVYLPDTQDFLQQSFLHIWRCV